MEWPRLLSYMREGEGTTTRFLGKVDSPDQLGPILVAMACTIGGKIFVGLDLKNYHLIGTNIDSHWVNNVITNYCSPLFRVGVEFVLKNDRTILCITVPEGNEKPYFYKDKCYVMEASRHRRAMEEEIREMSANTWASKQSAQDKSNSFSNLQTKPQDNSHSNSKTIHRGNYFDKLKKEQFLLQQDESEQDLNTITSELMTLSSDMTISTDEYYAREEGDEENDLSLPLSALEKKGERDERLNDRQRQALEYLERKGKIKNKQYREMFEISHKTAHLELADLVEKGYVFQDGSGRSTCYKLID